MCVCEALREVSQGQAGHKEGNNWFRALKGVVRKEDGITMRHAGGRAF